ncbi:hypothetical protein CEG14_05585 [Bordetella genomosp. 1]|uniref:Uncharacterized protein n=1 Tax=Bordetella genomosp. 1 TaxID=1395607 RepID=A0A261SNP7_9BORD|nr:hypothetical protein [Bordetella genomosp. 1]OZI39008.1 hypothetical protein CEG14_05585 [Bordetella genomosp. 1]
MNLHMIQDDPARTAAPGMAPGEREPEHEDRQRERLHADLDLEFHRALVLKRCVHVQHENPVPAAVFLMTDPSPATVAALESLIVALKRRMGPAVIESLANRLLVTAEECARRRLVDAAMDGAHITFGPRQ